MFLRVFIDVDIACLDASSALAMLKDQQHVCKDKGKKD